MTQFFIAPYQPTDDSSLWEALATQSDLHINVAEYRKLLIQRWSAIEFLPTTAFSLQWGIPVSTSGAHIYGALHTDKQVISIDTPFEEFFLWHRGVIPSKHKLFLFNDSAWNSIELTDHTTAEDIERFFMSQNFDGSVAD